MFTSQIKDQSIFNNFHSLLAPLPHNLIVVTSLTCSIYKGMTNFITSSGYHKFLHHNLLSYGIFISMIVPIQSSRLVSQNFFFSPIKPNSCQTHTPCAESNARSQPTSSGSPRSFAVSHNYLVLLLTIFRP